MLESKTRTDVRRKTGAAVLFYLLLGLASFGFLALFSFCTSPFSYCNNGSDAAFFRLVGQGMTRGYLPYRDFFDMKGPVLFFIEYLGQLAIYGRRGVFLVQWINLFAALVILCKLYDRFEITNRLAQLALLLPLSYVASYTFEGGNLTEEFSLIPLLSCLYLCLVFFDKRDEESDFWQRRIYRIAGIWFGVCLGLLAMIRITNAALLCAMVLTVALYLLKERKYRELSVCAGMCVLGLMLSAAPVLAFYGAKGLLREMLDEVFVLGFKYSKETSFLQHVTDTLSNQRRLLLVVPCCLPVLLRWRSWMERFLAVSGAVLTFFAIASGNNYNHYYTLTIPLLVLAELSLAESMRAKFGCREMLAAVLAALMLISQYSIMERYLNGAAMYLRPESKSDAERAALEIASEIPEAESDSVFGYNIDINWYLYTGLFPCIRYCDWQNHYIALIPEIYDDLENTFQTRPPAWLVLPQQQGTLPQFLERMLGAEYRRACENESYVLYRFQSG